MEQVQFRDCALYTESVTKHKEVTQKLLNFMGFKKINPLSAYGSSDTKFISDGPYGSIISNLRHAHLSSNISIVYRVHSRNPMLIDLYGVFSHEELGISNTSKINTQKTMSKRFSQQVFKQ